MSLSYLFLNIYFSKKFKKEKVPVLDREGKGQTESGEKKKVWKETQWRDKRGFLVVKMGGRKWEQKEINANPEDYMLLPNVYLDILMFYFQKNCKIHQASSISSNRGPRNTHKPRKIRKV